MLAKLLALLKPKTRPRPTGWRLTLAGSGPCSLCKTWWLRNPRGELVDVIVQGCDRLRQWYWDKDADAAVMMWDPRRN